MVEIFAVKLLEQDVFLLKKKELLSKLPSILIEKFNNYTHNKNLQRTIFGELLIRFYIGLKTNLDSRNLIFSIGEKGKPYLQNSNIHFNISHSGDWVVAAFSEKEIGIDIELIREPNYNVVKRYFSEKEILNINSITNPERKKNIFFDYWTIKESYLKAIGTGLTKSLSSFTVLFEEGKISITDDVNKEVLYINQFDFDKDYKLCVCSFEEPIIKEIRTIEF
jgi:4'-phosphopantetheinyl transferase